MQNIIARMKSANRWALAGAFVALVAIVAAVALGSARQPKPAQASFETVKAFTGNLSGSLAATGQLTPKRDASLAMAAPGIVKQVNVQAGDAVKTGDVLVQLDDDIARQNVDKANLAVQMAQVRLDAAQHDYNTKVTWTPNGNQLNAAQANLANAQAAVQAAQSGYDKVAWMPWVSSTQQSLALQQATNNYDKAKADMSYLITNRPDLVVSRDNLQAAQLSLSSAQVDLKSAQTALDNLTLIAPFDGTITAVHVEVGEAAAGPVVEMVTMDNLEVVLDIDQVDIGALKVGQKAAVTFDAWPGQPVMAKVISIAPKANATASVVNFEVHLALDRNDLELRAGMTAQAAIQTFSLTGVTLVPSQALTYDGATGKTYVSLVTPQGQRQTEVTLGAHDDQYTQVLSGVKDGDTLAVSH